MIIRKDNGMKMQKEQGDKSYQNHIISCNISYHIISYDMYDRRTVKSPNESSGSFSMELFMDRVVKAQKERINYTPLLSQVGLDASMSWVEVAHSFT